jgi:hypothetical protein
MILLLLLLEHCEQKEGKDARFSFLSRPDPDPDRSKTENCLQKNAIRKNWRDSVTS